VIAEGVEDERQAQILHALGCPLAQGFLFARPMSPEGLLEWLGQANALTRAGVDIDDHTRRVGGNPPPTRSTGSFGRLISLEYDRIQSSARTG
jgi:predicted signal transduction protein with EAL and GGDEF domain